nr:MAG TPA: hypothetical protein [Caudoviricetes sp.]
MASLSGSGASHKTESFFLSPAIFSLQPSYAPSLAAGGRKKGSRALEDVPGCGRAHSPTPQLKMVDPRVHHQGFSALKEDRRKRR